MNFEHNLEQFFLSTRYACIYIDPSSLIVIDANLAAQRLFGMGREALIAKSLAEFTLNEKDQLKKEIALAASGQKRGVTIKTREARSGNVIETLANVVPFATAGKEGRIAIVIPIKRREEPEKEDDFVQSMMEAMPSGAVLMGGDGGLVACNWKFQQMWRIPKPLLEKGSERELCAHMAGQLKEGERLARRPGEILNYTGDEHEDRVALHDGRTFEIMRHLVAGVGPTRGWIISFKDVSNVYEVERMLYEALQELGAIIDASRMGVIFVKKGRITRASHKTEEMLGYGAKEMEGLNAQSLFPKERVEAPAQSAGAGEALPDGVFMAERLFLRKNGSRFWAMLTGRALDPQAPATGAVWVIEDITEHKRADEKIRMSNIVFDNINEGIIISNIKGEIQFVNPAFTKVTGYSAEEVIGRRANFLKSGRHGKDFYHDMWKRLLEIGSWQGEIWNRRKSGEIFAEWLSITAMKNAHGETMNYTGVFSDITYRKDNEELVRHLAFHDPLTHLPNRRMFLERMDMELIHAKRDGAMVAMMFLDLDNFKPINDNFGHNAGDMVLQMTSERITKCLRESDSVSRFGGDEFTVLTPNIKSEQDAAAIAGKIMASLAGPPLSIGPAEVTVKASMGISMYPKDGLTGEDLVNKADRAMYFAKKQGKGAFMFFDATTML
jgi:diguanylate cyclase (GGDEF)-like protein/PAS domain S-box-containing protein